MTESKIEDSTLGLPSTSRSNSSKVEPKVKRSGSGKLLFFVGSFAAVIILGFLGFLGFELLSRSNANNDPLRIQGKVSMSEQELRDIVNAKRLTVYWAGPVLGAKYSLVAQKPGQCHITYGDYLWRVRSFYGDFETVENYRINTFTKLKPISSKIGEFHEDKNDSIK